ncbi:hypothetical protein I5Q34_09250 [Streptomyces sp. AV19]|uniref:hypothetical protein n=1 Tax=Streptomyces sp. AV19 TaxID=2793068 RepID=UPI0018FE407B|nr:hypothetical protein [Streptomyces sp. AV19]MBH1934471.1 hypothetical protein [Streptomyces sp. AV19]MDG4533263.1 hypothetical protein [Streptomyces sp. AV19]
MPVKQPTTVALALCGSLALGLAGAAVAVEPVAAPKPRPVVVPGVTARLAVLGSLGDTLSLGARIAKDAQAARPDLARLKVLQRQLADEGVRLHASARAQAQQEPANPKNKKKDATTDIKATLDQVTKDINQLLDDLAKNPGAVPGDVTKVVAGLQKLLTLVGGLNGLPTPVPLPVGLPTGR